MVETKRALAEAGDKLRCGPDLVIVLDVIVDGSSDSIRAVGESDFLALIRVARSTVKNWEASAKLRLSPAGVYDEGDVVAAICFAQLVDHLDLKLATSVWAAHAPAIRQACLLLPLHESNETLDLVVDTYTLTANVVSRPEEIGELVHVSVPAPRAFLLIPLTALVREARKAYWGRAVDVRTLKADRRRRPARRETKRTG